YSRNTRPKAWTSRSSSRTARPCCALCLNEGVRMNQDLSDLRIRVARLSLMIFDIDGTLTDGRIFWVPQSGWTQLYSVRDGMGIKRLLEAGLEVAAISGGDSLSAQMRMQSLGIKHVHFGSQDKMDHFGKLLALLKVEPENCGYMGDEVVDLP